MLYQWWLSDCHCAADQMVGSCLCWCLGLPLLVSLSQAFYQRLLQDQCFISDTVHWPQLIVKNRILPYCVVYVANKAFFKNHGWHCPLTLALGVCEEKCIFLCIHFMYTLLAMYINIFTFNAGQCLWNSKSHCSRKAKTSRFVLLKKNHKATYTEDFPMSLQLNRLLQSTDIKDSF